MPFFMLGAWQKTLALLKAPHPGGVEALGPCLASAERLGERFSRF